MKRGMALLLTLAMLFVLVSCTENNPSEDKQLKTKAGVAPYKLTKNEQLVLDLAGAEDTWLISYKQPEGATEFQVKTYYLDKNKKWIENGGGGIGNAPGDDSYWKLNGILSLQLKKDYVIEMGYRGDRQKCTYKSNKIKPKEEMNGYQRLVLTEFQEMKLNEEIPIAVFGYTKGTRLYVFELDYFYKPKQFREYDIVQVVTVQFTND